MGVTYSKTLQPISNRRAAPFREVKQIMTGEDTFYVYAGKWYDVPCCWELVTGRITLTTDATVANRNVHVRQLSGLGTVEENHGDDQAASLVVTYQMSPLRYASGFVTAPFQGIDRFSHLIWDEGRALWIVTDTGKAGDSIECRFIFRFLNWELGMLPPESVVQAELKAKASLEGKRGC